MKFIDYFKYWNKFSIIRACIFVIVAIILIFLAPYAALMAVGVMLGMEMVIRLAEHIAISYGISKVDPLMGLAEVGMINLGNAKPRPNICLLDHINLEELHNSKLPETLLKITYVQSAEQARHILGTLQMLYQHPVFKIILNSIIQQIKNGNDVYIDCHELPGAFLSATSCRAYINSGEEMHQVDVNCNPDVKNNHLTYMTTTAEILAHESTHVISDLKFKNHMEPFEKMMLDPN